MVFVGRRYELERLEDLRKREGVKTCLIYGKNASENPNSSANSVKTNAAYASNTQQDRCPVS